MTLAQRRYIDTSWRRAHYRKFKSREIKAKLIVLHQSPLSSQTFENSLPLLGKKFDCIAVDTPGFGRSYALPRESNI